MAICRFSSMDGQSEVYVYESVYGGETFIHETAEETADRLEMRQAIGYRVPDFTIAELREVDHGEA